MKNGCKIRLANEEIFPTIFEFLNKNIIFSGYIFPNIKHYCYNNFDFYKLYYALDEKNNVFFVGSMYFDTMHIICFSEEERFIEQLVAFICEHNIKRITANVEIVNQIGCIKNGAITNGLILLLDKNKFLSPFQKYSIEKAKLPQEFLEIAHLLRNDDSFKKNYLSDQILGCQLYERYKANNGRSYFYSEKNKIIATVSTYAECDNIAVISGVFTDDAYKGKGIGTFLLSVLKNNLVDENKNSIIYCFEEGLINFYEKLGVLEKKVCAKIEFF